MAEKNQIPKFLTVGQKGICELEIRHSRFIGVCMPVSIDQEAVEFITKVRGEHKKATHNVYAYRLTEGFRERYSDDGEPQGTAGLPVLGILKSADIFNACIVVTRYFGGTLLGTGGLVRAYSDTAVEALKTAGIRIVTLCDIFRLNLSYEISGRVIKALEKYTDNMSVEYGENITVTAAINCESRKDFEKDICEASLGKVTPIHIKKIYT